MKEDNYKDSLARPKGGDAGTGEIMFGLISLGFALIGYLDHHLPEVSGRGGLLVMVGVLVPTWGLAVWINRAILNYCIRPCTGYAVPWREAWPHTQSLISSSEKSSWTAIWVTGGIATMLVCLVVWQSNVSPALEWPVKWLMSLLGLGICGVVVGTYAYWFSFNGRREYPWKWLVILFLSIGLLVIGLPVRWNYFDVWPQLMVFTGVVWLLSGLGTLVSYIRHAKSPELEAE